MKLQPFLIRYKNSIEDELSNIQKDVKRDLSFKDDFMREFHEYLFRFSTRGKMFRGAAVIHAYRLYGGHDLKMIVRVAATIELVGSCILIHDDIIDNSDKRRGEPSFHMFYESEAKKRGIKNLRDFGHSCALLAGDIGYFIGFHLLSTLPVDVTLKNSASAFFAKEMAILGQAELIEYDYSTTQYEPSDDEIIKIYKYKTAHYTLSLPLMLGAIYAGAPEDEIKKLEHLGESVGVIYQMKDDELDVFGDSQFTGKPTGSDIKENKKTLLQHTLLNSVTDAERKKLLTLFGSNGLSVNDMQLIIQLCDKYNIKRNLQKIEEKLAHDARRIVESLTIEKEDKEVLMAFVDFNLFRDK